MIVKYVNPLYVNKKFEEFKSQHFANIQKEGNDISNSIPLLSKKSSTNMEEEVKLKKEDSEDIHKDIMRLRYNKEPVVREF